MRSAEHLRALFSSLNEKYGFGGQDIQALGLGIPNERRSLGLRRCPSTAFCRRPKAVSPRVGLIRALSNVSGLSIRTSTGTFGRHLLLDSA